MGYTWSGAQGNYDNGSNHWNSSGGYTNDVLGNSSNNGSNNSQLSGSNGGSTQKTQAAQSKINKLKAQRNKLQHESITGSRDVSDGQGGYSVVYGTYNPHQAQINQLSKQISGIAEAQRTKKAAIAKEAAVQAKAEKQAAIVQAQVEKKAAAVKKAVAKPAVKKQTGTTSINTKALEKAIHGNFKGLGKNIPIGQAKQILKEQGYHVAEENNQLVFQKGKVAPDTTLFRPGVIDQLEKEKLNLLTLKNASQEGVLLTQKEVNEKNTLNSQLLKQKKHGINLFVLQNERNKKFVAAQNKVSNQGIKDTAEVTVGFITGGAADVGLGALAGTGEAGSLAASVLGKTALAAGVGYTGYEAGKDIKQKKYNKLKSLAFNSALFTVGALAGAAAIQSTDLTKVSDLLSNKIEGAKEHLKLHTKNVYKFPEFEDKGNTITDAIAKSGKKMKISEILNIAEEHPTEADLYKMPTKKAGLEHLYNTKITEKVYPERKTILSDKISELAGRLNSGKNTYQWPEFADRGGTVSKDTWIETEKPAIIKTMYDKNADIIKSEVIKIKKPFFKNKEGSLKLSQVQVIKPDESLGGSGSFKVLSDVAPDLGITPIIFPINTISKPKSKIIPILEPISKPKSKIIPILEPISKPKSKIIPILEPISKPKSKIIPLSIFGSPTKNIPKQILVTESKVKQKSKVKVIPILEPTPPPLEIPVYVPISSPSIVQSKKKKIPLLPPFGRKIKKKKGKGMKLRFGTRTVEKFISPIGDIFGYAKKPKAKGGKKSRSKQGFKTFQPFKDIFTTPKAKPVKKAGKEDKVKGKKKTWWQRI